MNVISQSQTVHTSLGPSRHPGRTLTTCNMNLTAPEIDGGAVDCIYCAAMLRYGNAVKGMTRSGTRSVAAVAEALGASIEEVRRVVAAHPDMIWGDGNTRMQIAVINTENA